MSRIASHFYASNRAYAYIYTYLRRPVSSTSPSLFVLDSLPYLFRSPEILSLIILDPERERENLFFFLAMLLFFSLDAFKCFTSFSLFVSKNQIAIGPILGPFIRSAANLLEIVNIQSSNLRGDKKNNKRHFFERLSVTLQRENGSMLLERSPLPAPNVDGEL